MSKKKKKSITRYTQEPCRTKIKVKWKSDKKLKRRSGRKNEERRKESFWKKTVRNYHIIQNSVMSGWGLFI